MTTQLSSFCLAQIATIVPWAEEAVTLSGKCVMGLMISLDIDDDDEASTFVAMISRRSKVIRYERKQFDNMDVFDRNEEAVDERGRKALAGLLRSS